MAQADEKFRSNCRCACTDNWCMRERERAHSMLLLTIVHVVHCAFVVYIVSDDVAIQLVFSIWNLRLWITYTLTCFVPFVCLYFECSFVSRAMYRSTSVHTLAARTLVPVPTSSNHTTTRLSRATNTQMKTNELLRLSSSQKRMWKWNKMKWKCVLGDRSANL